MVQEAFARALARPQALKDVDAPEAWLRTVAVNLVRRRWRRRQILTTILRKERPVHQLVAEAPGPERADLRDAMAALPRVFREVIVLHYLADLPVDEVAGILDVPVGTVNPGCRGGPRAARLAGYHGGVPCCLDGQLAPPRPTGSARADRTGLRISAGVA